MVVSARCINSKEYPGETACQGGIEQRVVSGKYRINYTVDVTVAVTVTYIFLAETGGVSGQTDKVNAV